MDVTDQFREIGLLLADNGWILVLQQMAPPMIFPDRIA
jgi:hypothetical protein